MEFQTHSLSHLLGVNGPSEDTFCRERLFLTVQPFAVKLNIASLLKLLQKFHSLNIFLKNFGSRDEFLRNLRLVRVESLTHLRGMSKLKCEIPGSFSKLKYVKIYSTNLIML